MSMFRAGAHRARRAGSTGSGDRHAVLSVHFLTAVNGSTGHENAGSAQHALPKSADRFPDGSERGALPKKGTSLT
jgi:hypothetical protein